MLSENSDLQLSSAHTLSVRSWADQSTPHVTGAAAGGSRNQATNKKDVRTPVRTFAVSGGALTG
jgi:hypothetical protein